MSELKIMASPNYLRAELAAKIAGALVVSWDKNTVYDATVYATEALILADEILKLNELSSEELKKLI
jgi:hypothetical protein